MVWITLQAHKFWTDKFLGIVRLKFNLDNLETPQDPVTLQLAPAQELGANSAVIASFVGTKPLSKPTDETYLPWPEYVQDSGTWQLEKPSRPSSGAPAESLTKTDEATEAKPEPKKHKKKKAKRSHDTSETKVEVPTLSVETSDGGKHTERSASTEESESKTKDKKADQTEHPLGRSKKWKDKDDQLEKTGFVVIQGGTLSFDASEK